MIEAKAMAMERRALQLVVGLACLVPLGAGGAGAFCGPALFGGPTGPLELDSHFRYLSGLLLAVGIAFASTVPAIERRRRRFRLLTAIVVIGGCARCISVVALGLPTLPTMAALAMELIVTPALALWQGRVARQAAVP